MRRPVALLLLLVLVLSTSFSGCLGLVLSREMMEWSRGPPTENRVVTVYQFNHTFDSTDPADIIFNPEPASIRIDSEVKELRIYFRVQMDWSEIAGFETNNLTGNVRYVHARLWLPDTDKNSDQPFWENNATSDKYPPMQRYYPPFEDGVWELEVEAQGYGVTTPVDQLSFHDEFDVSVSVVRPCIEFPELAESGECIPV